MKRRIFFIFFNLFSPSRAPNPATKGWRHPFEDGRAVRSEFVLQSYCAPGKDNDLQTRPATAGAGKRRVPIRTCERFRLGSPSLRLRWLSMVALVVTEQTP
jgi:hypothetical protein